MEGFNNLGTWLPAKVKAKNLDMSEFAAKAKISRSALYHFMKDVRRPDQKTIERICKALGVPVEEGKAQYTPKKPGRRKQIKNGPGMEQPTAVAPGEDR